MNRHQVSIGVAAAPAVLYDLLADITRMPEWSPEVTRCTWLDGHTCAVPRARFRGWSRNGWRRWSTVSTVIDADRPARFAWNVRFAGRPVATWAYDFEGDDRHATVTETVTDERGRYLRQLSPFITGVRDRRARNDETMNVTLSRLRAAAERTSTT